MNNKGFIDLEWPDFDVEPAMFILPAVGALFGLFTASGGFSYMISGETFNPGIFTKIVATVGGAIAGYVWAFYGTK